MNSDNSDCFGFDSIQGAAAQDENQLDSRLTLIEQRQSNIEYVIRTFSGRLDTIEQVLGVGSKQNQVYTSDKFPEEWSLRTKDDYVNLAQRKIAELRNNFEWRACFNAQKIDGITDEQRSKINFILTKGPIDVSKIVNNISLEILGSDLIKTYLIGVNGLPVTKKGGHDKRPTLPLEYENRLRVFFSLIDKIFISPQGWENLIRKPVNQMGREFASGKRKNIDPIEQAMFLHSFLEKRPSVATPISSQPAISTHEKNAIEGNKDGTPASANNKLIMAMEKSPRCTQLDNQPTRQSTSTMSSPLTPIPPPQLTTSSRRYERLDAEFESIYRRTFQ